MRTITVNHATRGDPVATLRTGEGVKRSAGKPGVEAPRAGRFGHRLIDAVVQRDFTDQIKGYRAYRSDPTSDHPPADFLFAADKDPKLPDEVFKRLQWGGVFVYADLDQTRVQRIAQDYNNKRGFLLQTPHAVTHLSRLGLRLPGLCKRIHYFAARKVALIQPGDVTERFTYKVELMPHPEAEHGYVVCKEVPTYADVTYRLRHRFPDADENDIQARATKLVDSVFPTFLTREAAILKILQTEMPEPYRSRVPRPMGVIKDGNGFVRRLAMNWLRTGGPMLSQIEFARQSAELLTVLHNQASVMHLDLRLDNFVLTHQGVGFVDFGSAARIGENIEQSPLLTSLFGEMMRTSKIQRMLGAMLEKGQVTNQSFTCIHQKPDPAIDTFYLALQINRPTHNPQFAHLLDYDPTSVQAQAISGLTAAVLRPKDQRDAPFQTADDILKGIQRIQRRLIRKPVA